VDQTFYFLCHRGNIGGEIFEFHNLAPSLMPLGFLHGLIGFISVRIGPSELRQSKPEKW
jgi:hypothetical protein